MNENGIANNTDRELWREKSGDYYAHSIHVTEDGGIGINCGGHVIVMPLMNWHILAVQEQLRRQQEQAVISSTGTSLVSAAPPLLPAQDSDTK